ncbi:MAG: DeoR/GlpR family DNA-binding transcription regulator [Bacillota bacterium]
MEYTANERRQEIKRILMGQKEMSVKELSKYFNISEVTIRKDLRKLESEEAIVRGHGSARISNWQPAKMYSLREKMMENYEYKMRIAAKAASMVKEWDVVLLGAGSTCCMIAQLLCKRHDIIIVTNAINFESQLETINARLIFLGGEYDQLNGSVTGTFALDALSSMNIDKFFLGTSGVTPQFDITSYELSNNLIIKTMIQRSKEVILVADHTKFGKSMAIKIADLDMVDVVITNKELDLSIIQEIQNRNKTLILT